LRAGKSRAIRNYRAFAKPLLNGLEAR